MDAIVVGGGQAGLAISQQLVERELDHVVLERGLIGDSWRTRRWDGFHMVSPNWANTLPGQPPVGRYDEFATATQFADAMAGYAGHLGLPVRENEPALAARRDG